MIRLTSFLSVWFQCVCPLMPSCNTYRLNWVSSTFGAGGCDWRTKRRRLRPAHIAQPRGTTPRPRSGHKLGRPHARGAAAKRSHPTPEARGSGGEELPNARGRGLQPRGATPRPRSGGSGAGGPKGATPCSRSGGVAVRSYPSSKVRSRGCASLEQL